MSKKWLFFDCFGVFIDEPFEMWEKDETISAEQLDKLRQTLYDVSDFNTITEPEALRRITEIMQMPAQDFLTKSWYKKARINTELVDWVKTAAQKYRIVMLSNSALFYLEPLLKRYQLKDLFEKFFISAEMKVAKPSKEIFLRALRECGCQPEDAVMIDDREVNIKTAKSVGMHGVVLKNTKDAIRQIKKVA